MIKKEYINLHKSVLLDEAISYLPNKNNLNVIDATYGGGGYTNTLSKLKNIKNLIAMDCDPEVISFIKNNKKFKFVEGKFSQIDKNVYDFVKENKIKGFDAIFFDLGISSNQIDNPKRGFSFNFDGPLDMRMNKKGLSAYELINKFEEKKNRKYNF